MGREHLAFSYAIQFLVINGFPRFVHACIRIIDSSTLIFSLIIQILLRKGPVWEYRRRDRSNEENLLKYLHFSRA